MINTQSKNALQILHLLLRCGMVCREELNVVLEMMPAVADSRAVELQEHGSATAQHPVASQHREEPGSQTRQNTIILDFDRGV